MSPALSVRCHLLSTACSDIAPEHEALMLLEQLLEIGRTDDAAKRSQDYRTTLADSEKAAESLRLALKAPDAPATIAAAFAEIGPSCSACHQRNRNQ